MYRVCTSLRLKSVLLLGMQCHSLLKLFALSSWDFVARRCTHVRQPFTSEGARWSQPWRHGLFWICISLVCSRTFRTALAARLCCKGCVEKRDAATVLLLLWRHASVMIRSFAPCVWMIRTHSSLCSKFSSTLSADVFVAMGCFICFFDHARCRQPIVVALPLSMRRLGLFRHSPARGLRACSPEASWPTSWPTSHLIWTALAQSEKPMR